MTKQTKPPAQVLINSFSKPIVRLRGLHKSDDHADPLTALVSLVSG